MAREITQRDLEDLGDERFEDLVAAVVFAEYPDAERPDAPDGGADVLVPATGAHGPLVWQVKHYTGRIGWKKCEDSLDAAVRSYDPEAVTFVFPRNLTKPRRDEFQERLVNRHPKVKVTYWGSERIKEMLARHPDIATRFFKEDRAELLPGLLRAVAQGGKELENTHDIADRAFELDSFADLTDPSFEYEMSFGRADPAPNVWSDTPFMVIEEVRDGRRFTTEARLRPEAKGELLGGFTDDDAGERSREKAREAFAAGESVEVNEGVWMQANPAPVAAMEAYKAAKERGLTHGLAKLSPGQPHEFEMRLELAGETTTRRFVARPVPPRADAQLAYGSAQDGLAVFLDFQLDNPPVVSIDFRLSFRPREDAAVNAGAAKFVLDFYRAERVVCLAPGFLPEDGIAMDEANKPTASVEDLAHLEFTAVLYDAVAVIEQKFGPVSVPEQMTREEFEAALAAASIMRNGGGSMRFEELALEVPFHDVDRVIKGAQSGHSGQHPVKLPVFGRELDLGIAEFQTPPVNVVATEKASAEGMVRLRFRTDRTDVPFRLVQPLTEAPATSSKLWTPGEGPSGMVQLPG